ncbi:MAG TPA: hypothetical protein PLP27_02650 [Crocinitomicaceae bacterium]|nr:hypothetical protein [Crocinitomicaceae bacterium]
MNPNPNQEIQTKIFEFLQFMKEQEIVLRQEISELIANKVTDLRLIEHYLDTLDSLNQLQIANDLTVELQQYYEQVKNVK